MASSAYLTSQTKKIIAKKVANMTDILEYTLSLNDQFSSKLQKIGITTDTTLGIFGKLEKQANDVKRVMKATGGSVGALKMKLDHLKRERDWLPQSSINNIRKYNTEIKKLTRQINKLETINGSKTKSMFTDAFNQIPFLLAKLYVWVLREKCK